MKRIALLLAALLMFSLTGCGSSEAAGEASNSDKAGAYEVIPPEDGRGDLIPASSDVVSIGRRSPLHQHGKSDEREL